MRANKEKTPRIEKIARERFDYESLRPGQKEAIESVVAGRDTLVVMPTGAGKSAVYQIAAQLLNGPAVIVSPLIALQKDQVEALKEQDVGGAAVINSSVSAGKQKELLEDLEQGDLEYMFLTPEQLSRADVLERVSDAKPALFVVDEAHCISEWGHDFRPDYLNLGRVIEHLGHPVTLALTATASASVREEITTRLCMRNPAVLVNGFDRPNIWLGVNTAPNQAAKQELLLARVAEAEKPGIVYVSSRKRSEEIAALLEARGVHALAYHGGMTPNQRSPIQDDFMEDRIEVIVATSAFGMGVDKPNVRFVFYYDVPHSIDAFYQGIGRAGRDGEPARALLFYRPEDLGIHKFFAGSAKSGSGRLQQVATAILEEGEPVAWEDLLEKTELSRSRLTQTLNRLENAGAVEVLPSGEVQASAHPEDLERITEEAAAAIASRHEAELDRIERMRVYAESVTCRRAYILQYFGEDCPANCGNCDNCLHPEAIRVDASAQLAPPPPDPVKMRNGSVVAPPAALANGMHVKHKKFGDGVVAEANGDTAVIRFNSVGEKTVAPAAILASGVLEVAE